MDVQAIETKSRWRNKKMMAKTGERGHVESTKERGNKDYNMVLRRRLMPRSAHN